MIPLGDVIPVRTRPFVAYGVIVVMLAAGGSMLQLAANVMAVWIFGQTIEDRMAHGRFAAFVMLCASLAAAAQSAADRSHPLAVAVSHGAAAAVIGAYFAAYPQSRVLLLIPAGLSLRVIEVQAVVFLALWYMLQVVGALGALVATPVAGVIPSWAHAVGVMAGAGLVRPFRRPERERVEWWNQT
jgi:membrane associated rhomboid family serine protease